MNLNGNLVHKIEIAETVAHAEYSVRAMSDQLKSLGLTALSASVDELIPNFVDSALIEVQGQIDTQPLESLFPSLPGLPNPYRARPLPKPVPKRPEGLAPSVKRHIPAAKPIPERPDGVAPCVSAIPVPKSVPVRPEGLAPSVKRHIPVAKPIPERPVVMEPRVNPSVAPKRLPRL